MRLVISAPVVVGAVPLTVKRPKSGQPDVLPQDGARSVQPHPDERPDREGDGHRDQSPADIAEQCGADPGTGGVITTVVGTPATTHGVPIWAKTLG